MVQLVIAVGLGVALVCIVIGGLIGTLSVGTYATGLATGGLVCLGGLVAISIARLRR